MALPIEQLTQRAEKTVVAFQTSERDDAVAETVWAATTNFGTQTITLDIDNSSNFSDRETDDRRLGTVNEVQVVSLTGGPTGGTFTLSFGGNTTSGIAFGAAAATVQTALTGLTSIGSGNATVTGSLPGGLSVEFKGDLAGVNVATMTGSGASLTGGTSPAVVITVDTEGYTPA